MTAAIQSRQLSPPPDAFGESLARAIMMLYGLFLILYIWGSLVPESSLWGVHQLAFLGTGSRFALVILSGALVVPVISSLCVPRLEHLVDLGAQKRRAALPLLVAAGAAAGLLCYSFRISTDMYGDSRTLLTLLAGRTFTVGDLFRFDIADNDLREPLTRLIHQSIAHASGLDQKLVFQIVSSMCGGLFVVGFSRWALSVKGTSAWKSFLLVAGLTCGANQLFFGHVEDYTLVYLAIVGFLLLAWKFFEGFNSIPLMALLLVIGFLLHTAMALFLPALLYLLVYSASQRRPRMKPWIGQRAVLAALVLTVAAGTWAYFFYFKADRLLVGDQKERGGKVFLPLFNSMLPPHMYTLLSINHVSDIVQELLLTVSPGTVVLLCAGLVFYRQVRWSSPRTMFFGIAAFFFMLFNATVNPLLTPERDWDMLSLAAPAVLFFAFAVSADWFDRLSQTSFPRTAIAVSVALALLSCSMLYVNSQPLRAGERLRALGEWAFKSYYLGSAYLLNVGAKYTQDRGAEISERRRALAAIEPEKSEPDLEAGFLYHKLADVLFLDGRYEEAGRYYSKSRHEDPYNASAIKALAGVALLSGNLDGAVEFMSSYNSNINGGDIVDLDGLIIAEKMNHLKYLLYTKADTAAIMQTLESIHLEPRQ